MLGWLIIRVPAMHMYLFSDACPTDWLANGQEDTWHTIANFTFQSDPSKQALVEAGAPHAEVLDSDSMYLDLVKGLESRLPSGTLRKWKTGPGYRERFCQSVEHAAESNVLMISACSFQERTLRNSKPALLASYNRSDRLSGDSDSRATHEFNLRRLIDSAEENAPIVLTRSPVSDSFSGDLIVDNLAGWLNAAIANPSGIFGDAIRRSANTGVWRGWHLLRESATRLESTPALERVMSRSEA